MTNVHIELLGPVQVTVAGRQMHLGGQGCRAVLATLAVHKGVVVSLGQLLDAVWDTEPPRTAVTKLQGHVSRLRREFVELGGPDAALVVQTKPPGYVLCQHRTTTDVSQFDAFLRGARELDVHARADQLSAALALWRGPACADVGTSAIRSLCTVLDERRMRAVEDLAALRLELGDHDDALESLHALVREAPFRERAWEYLLRGYVGQGDALAALRLYDEFRRLLKAELGVEPGPRLQELVGSLGAHARPSVAPSGAR